MPPWKVGTSGSFPWKDKCKQGKESCFSPSSSAATVARTTTTSSGQRLTSCPILWGKRLRKAKTSRPATSAWILLTTSGRWSRSPKTGTPLRADSGPTGESASPKPSGCARMAPFPSTPRRRRRRCGGSPTPFPCAWPAASTTVAASGSLSSWLPSPAKAAPAPPPSLPPPCCAMPSKPRPLAASC